MPQRDIGKGFMLDSAKAPPKADKNSRCPNTIWTCWMPGRPTYNSQHTYHKKTPTAKKLILFVDLVKAFYTVHRRRKNGNLEPR